MIGTYSPLNELKTVAENVWIVDGPLIQFGPSLLKLPFSTRMTIVRVTGRALFIHSPTPLPQSLREEVAKLGEPTYIIAPNRIHYWWVPDWKHAYPSAQVHVAPGVRERALDRIDFPTSTLDGELGYPWHPDVLTLPVRGSYMTEFVFYHRASRTLILTDLIENFEPDKLSFWMRCLTRLGGVQDPDGQMPRDMRMSFLKRRRELHAAVKRMIEWGPERILLAHGRWYDKQGVQELHRAFRWILT